MPTTIISDNTTGRDFTGSDGGRMAESLPNSKFMSPSGGTLFVSDDGGTNQQHSLLKFTGLSNITGPVTVSSATVEIYMTVGGASAADVAFHKCLRAWSEAETTWNRYNDVGSLDWTTPGATGSGDINLTASAVVNVNTTTGAYKSFSSAGLAADVQDWVNGGSTNNGWLIKIDNETGTGPEKNFAGPPDTDGQRPKLTVVYTTGGGGDGTYSFTEELYL